MNDWHDLGGDQGLYLENVLDHYRAPHNFGPLAEATFSHREMSLSCGDALELAVKLDDAGRVADAKFQGSGCALSVAAASMLTDYIKGRTVAELQALSQEDVFKLLGFEVGVSRLRCALLGLKTLELGLADHLKNYG